MTKIDKPRVPAQPWRGDVWYVDFPNRPNDPHLPRPAVVISNDNRNEFSESVLVIPISDEERGKLLPTHLFLQKKTGGLIKDSRALCEQIVSVDKEKFVEKLGSIPSTILTSLVRGVQKAIE